MHVHVPEAHVVWEFLGSATMMSFLGHAVSTFPKPASPIGRWVLGNLQWIVGQRNQAAETFAKPPAPDDQSQNDRTYGRL